MVTYNSKVYANTGTYRVYLICLLLELMNIDYIITLVCVLSMSLLGIVIFLRNPKMTNNRYFAMLALAISAWTVFNLLSGGKTTNKLLVDLVFVSGIATTLSVILFMSNFPNENIINKRIIRVIILTTVVISALVFHPDFVRRVTVDEIITGPIYNVFIAYIVIALALLMILVTRQFKASKNIIARRQVTLIAWGVMMYAVLAVSSNVIIPLIVDSWSSSRFGPVASLFLVGFVAYSIVKHRLFDIRSLVVRTIVYLLSIATVGIIYAVLVYGAGAQFIDISNLSFEQKTLFVILALLIAITYAPIIQFFNKITTKLFYRDAYDTQVVLDQIGKIIVGSIDLHKIEKSALRVLADALRPTYTGFVLKSTTGGIDTQDFVGEAPRFKSEELAKTLSMISKHEVVYDEIDQSNELAQLMRINDISFITPLITKNETIGYLLSGPKKSGNIYSQQDKSMVTIASNELAVALQNAQRFDEIQAFNITLQEKVDEATKELKRTNRKLVELDEAKDEFISMASHQLRTPLTSIKGYISMLVEGDLGKLTKQQQSALKEAFISSQRMVFLISDFLNVSRIRTGKFVIEPKEVDLAKMVSEEMVQLREMAESKQLDVAYQKPSGFPLVKLDDNKMRQVIMNMIDNAIYYTPSDGTIEIQLYVDGKDVVFKVIDTGIGVPKAEQHKLFAKFFRAANARKARPDGTGLGLFMAQKVVVAQNGSMIFESEEGKGSTFGFRFPLSQIKI